MKTALVPPPALPIATGHARWPVVQIACRAASLHRNECRHTKPNLVKHFDVNVNCIDG